MRNYDFIKVGAKVWWEDPDQGISSGWYEVIDIGDEELMNEYDSRDEFIDDMVILITNGVGEAEVPASELYKTKR
jgi:hypothetical protein